MQYRSFAGCAWAAGDATAIRAASDARVRMVRRMSVSFESEWVGMSASLARLLHSHASVGVGGMPCVRDKAIMTQPAAGNVISATVHDGVPAYRERTCTRRSRRTTLALFGSGILEVLMQKSFLLAATAALALFMQIPLALAQSAPAAGGTAAPTATTTAPAATSDTSSQPADSKKSASKKPAKKKMTRQQEIDHSVDTGTVPARYRSSVPKQYQQYIPFDKQ